MTSDRIDVVVDGPSAVVDDFMPLDCELLNVRRRQDPDLLTPDDLRRIEEQCRTWTAPAVAAFRAWVAAAGPEWQLSDESCIAGTYRNPEGGGCAPCVQVTGVLSRGNGASIRSRETRGSRGSRRATSGSTR